MDPSALARVFLSERGPHESPLLENPVIRLQPGERRLLYTWIQVAPGTRLQGVGLNLASTTPGLLDTLSHTYANPTDEEGALRWIELAGAPYGGKLGDLFENSVAVSLFRG